MASLTPRELELLGYKALGYPLGGIVASIPLPMGEDGHAIGIFFNRVLPVPNKAVDWPPHHLVVLDPETGELLRSRPVKPSEIGPDAPADDPLPRHPDERRIDAEVFWSSNERLLAISPDVWRAYARGRVKVDPATRALVEEHACLFDIVAVKPLLPYYHTIHAPFFAWMEKVLATPPS